MEATSLLVLLRNMLRQRPRRGRYSYVMIALLLFNIYFIAQLFVGHNSIKQYRALRLAHQSKSDFLKTIKDKNDSLKLEMSLLSGGVPNIDYLEELAKAQLNYSYAEEKVIILP